MKASLLLLALSLSLTTATFAAQHTRHPHASPQSEFDAKRDAPLSANQRAGKKTEPGAAPGGGDLASRVLPIQYTCSSTLRIRAQDMTSAQLAETCQKLATQESRFHQRLATNHTPVANDNNTQLEVVVFDDYNQYKRYAGKIYGISTNNGGMYLEGNPSDPNNQARFIAHEASWLRPAFSIWNLEHEYTHYLDGRFDMYGDFSASTSAKTIWWIEGVAEYMALGDVNPDAIIEARKLTYTLSQVFQNTYSHDSVRVYDWGYLATRFMFEKHRSDVDQIVYLFRSGQYTAYTQYMNNLGTVYDSEFRSWLMTVQ